MTFEGLNREIRIMSYKNVIIFVCLKGMRVPGFRLNLSKELILSFTVDEISGRNFRRSCNLFYDVFYHHPYHNQLLIIFI
jgi:hypothetical protein